MHSKNSARSPKELAAYEANHDLAAELLQAVREMKAGQVHVVTCPVVEAAAVGCDLQVEPVLLEAG